MSRKCFLAKPKVSVLAFKLKTEPQKINNSQHKMTSEFVWNKVNEACAPTRCGQIHSSLARGAKLNPSYLYLNAGTNRSKAGTAPAWRSPFKVIRCWLPYRTFRAATPSNTNDHAAEPPTRPGGGSLVPLGVSQNGSPSFLLHVACLQPSLSGAPLRECCNLMGSSRNYHKTIPSLRFQVSTPLK